jgi:signal transduction histidine kinase
MTCADGARPAFGSYWTRLAVVMAASTITLAAVFGAMTPWSVAATLLHVVANSVALGGLAGVVMPPVRRRLHGMSWATQWGLTLLTLLGVTVLGTALACAVLALLGHRAAWSIADCVRADLWVNVIIVGPIGIAVTLYESQRARLDTLTLELRTKELERERASKIAVEARLSSLESRLHPHFLFNTLNTISALIQEDPERAERMVERLAALLRSSLDATAAGVVPLEREMKLVADYLAIEAARLGDRLTYRLDVSPAAAACEIPPLAVQTLVENSIKHAVAPRPRGGRVTVTATATNGRLDVAVWDDGPGFSVAAITPGHGLENLKSRLAERYGPAATLDVAPYEGGVQVSVSLPRRG